MLRKSLWYLLLVMLPSVCHAGQTVIRETADQIYVEYYADENEAKAASAAREKDDATKEKEAQAEAKHAEKIAKKIANYDPEQYARDHQE